MEDMYPDSNETKPTGDGSEMQDDGKETALLPKSMLGNAKPGDTVTLRIVSTLEDECEVERCDECKTEGEGSDGEPSMDIKIERLAGK